MIIFACHASTHMVGAGDTWVALACGRHFLNHGVDTVEPFSANSHRAGPTEEDIKTWPRWAQWITDKVLTRTGSHMLFSTGLRTNRLLPTLIHSHLILLFIGNSQFIYWWLSVSITQPGS
ncbi:MAG: hypothetical protein ACYTBP_11270 [Planctomycetota bacterium]